MSRCVYWDAAGLPGNERLLLLAAAAAYRIFAVSAARQRGSTDVTRTRLRGGARRRDSQRCTSR